MRAESVRSVLSFTLLLCLLIGLITFAVLEVEDLNKPAKIGVNPGTARKAPTNHTHPPDVKGDEDNHIKEEHATNVDTKDVDNSPNYTIMLNLGADNSSSGQVYIQYEDRLGFVCSDGFRDTEAQVVCRELGYQRGLKYDMLSHPDYSRYTDHEPILSGLHCTGSETHIKDCGGFDLDVNVTSCSWFAAVVCYNGQRPYELRLINTRDSQDSGLVEMKLGGVWGVVCAIRTFDDELADILCRNMNYTGGITMERGVSGEVTSENVWVPYISCDVGEPVKKSIFECNLILHTDNILTDRIDFRSNRYRNEYMACMDKPNSFAAAVHCLHMK